MALIDNGTKQYEDFSLKHCCNGM